MQLLLRPALAIALLALPSAASPCTSVHLAAAGSNLFGKNYDWNVDHGLLVVNQRGVRRAASPREPGEGEAARWSSRYGSVTFNQYGRGFPSGGMNEAGLVIELMWLDEGEYPGPDARPVVGVLEWIQYQLDTAATVAEVIASDSAVRISGRAPLHYLLADRSGSAAAVEFIKGRMVVHAGGTLPARALANSTYADSLAWYRRSAESRRGAGDNSLRRFSEAARRSDAFASEAPASPIAYAFETLEQVSQKSTRWSIVYDIGRHQVHFRTRRQPAIRSVSLDGLAFGCDRPPLALDLNEAGSGPVDDRLRPLTFERNLWLVRASYAETDFLAGTSEEELRGIAGLPESERCEGSGAGSGR